MPALIHVPQQVIFGDGGNSIPPLCSQNKRRRDGDFMNTILMKAINVFTLLKFDQTTSATRCKPCAKHVVWIILGNKVNKLRIALCIYGAASVAAKRILLYSIPENNNLLEFRLPAK